MAFQVPSTSKLRLSEFTLDSVTFEFRYTNAFVLWDRSGKLWTEATRKWPDLEMVTAQPNRTVFKIGDRIEMTAELGSARITSYLGEFPPSQFPIISKEFLELASTCLGLNVFSRVGLRFAFSRAFADRAVEIAAMHGTGFIKTPEEGYWGTEGQPGSLDYRVRWEGKRNGVQIRIAHEDRVFEIQNPMGVRMEVPKRQEFHGVVFDIDFFTLAPTEIGQLDADSWIQTYIKELKRQADHFFGAEK